MNERVKELRQLLNMKQIDFAKALSISQGHLSDIENGRKEVTNRFIEICVLKFNTNEEWLRNGTGNPFSEYDKKARIRAFANNILNEPESFKTKFFEALSKFNEEDWKYLENFFSRIMAGKDISSINEVATATGTDNITSEPHMQQTDASDTATTVEDAEAAYIKSISENARMREQSVSFISNAIAPTGTDGSN